MQSSGDGWGGEDNLEVRPGAASRASFLSAYKVVSQEGNVGPGGGGSVARTPV